MKVVLRIPNECEALMSNAFEIPHVVAFSDASHAPMKSTGRRGVTGGVLTYGCCCIKTLSRHQQLVSLSSMESELHALQHVAQEMSALQKVIGRILNIFQEVKVTEVPGVLYSDSESALKLLRNLDVPRKSRHLEIRIEWIKERVALGQLSLIFRKGVDNPSDLLTKCLGSAAFGIHRSTLGFQVCEGSLAGLVAVAKRSLVFIEVCCRENSAICQACREMGIQYIGISKDMEKRSVFSNLLETLKQMKPAKCYVHVSSPCTSGFPLRILAGMILFRKPMLSGLMFFQRLLVIWNWVTIPVLNCHEKIQFGIISWQRGLWLMQSMYMKQECIYVLLVL